MPIEITMPALSPTMTEGKLLRWAKAVGDTIKAGDVIAEIETDKATMEVEAVDEGVLGQIVVPEGQEGVPVGAVIAYILADGEKPGALAAAKPAAAPAGPAPAASAAPSAAPVPSVPAPVPTVSAAAKPAGERIFATPLARRLAAEAGIELAGIAGSGPHGRIVQADVLAAKSAPKPATTGPVAKTAGPAPLTPAAALTKERVQVLAGGIAFELQPHTSMRKAIARRLTEAKQTIPHFYLTVDTEIDALLDIRAKLNARADGAYKLSVNDFVIRAAAVALKRLPEANASWSDDGVLLWKTVDIAVAVAIDGGLITPIIKGADQKGLATISNEMKDLGARARAGKLKLEEFQGGTFSISNLGMFGIREFAAVINPPHGAILAVGVGEERVVVKNGAPAVATVMTCTLSVDHRVIDGAMGANFLKIFKGLIEDPLAMLV
jgi:pyruvate dehydrogenase E2 component (dihydrolipoamide acetyltransferase)